MFHLEKLITFSQYSRHRSSILLVVDLVIVAIAFIAACALDLMGGFPVRLDGQLQVCAVYAAIMLVVYGCVFIATGIHRSLWTFISAKELFSIVVAVVIATGIGLVILIMLPVEHISPLRYSFLSACLIVIGMSGLRIAYRAFREHVLLKKDSQPRQRALIVGAEEPGYVLLKELQRNIRLHTEVIGFIDSNRVGTVVSGVQVLGSEKDIVKLAEQYEIGLVYIAGQGLSHQRKVKLIKQLTDKNIRIKVMRFDEENTERDIAHSIEDVSVEDLLGRGQVKLDQKEISSYLHGKNVLVTGAGGSIGSQIVREVLKFRPKALYMLDINENSLYLLDRELEFLKQGTEDSDPIEVLPLIVNIREYEELDKVFASYAIDTVFHAAAHKHVPLMEDRPQEAVKNNVFGTKNVMDCAVKHGVERFIMISTDKAVNPANVMGASKRMTEFLLQAVAKNTKTKMAAVRFGNVLGSNGSVIPIFKEQIKKGGPITLTDKRITRYFMTIPEATQLVLQAGFYAQNGDIFVLDMGKPVKIIDLAENLVRLAGYEPYTDIDIIETGLRPGEKMFEELFLESESHTKTKNNLIYRKRRQAVDQVRLARSLRRLRKVTENDAAPTKIREELFAAITNEKPHTNPKVIK
ncbi:MAG: polysaccharide biosynthesis protein [Candidatus Doudnabacteria bacterium]|nr:polysaccharide biosynthesis protein [Candidatus Doudnabacteria bacterium]